MDLIALSICLIATGAALAAMLADGLRITYKQITDIERMKHELLKGVLNEQRNKSNRRPDQITRAQRADTQTGGRRNRQAPADLSQLGTAQERYAYSGLARCNGILPG